MCAGCRDASRDSVGSDRSERSRPAAGAAGGQLAAAPGVQTAAAPGVQPAAAPPLGSVEVRTEAGALARDDHGRGPALRAPEPVGGSWVTCYGNFRPTSTPERDVTRLGLLCGPANGMKQIGSTVVGEAGDVPAEHALEARAGDCFRILAVAEPAVTDLAVEVRSPKGIPLASDHNNDRWPIVNPDGPFCLLDAGRHVVRVHARQGRGHYALQIWRLP